MMKLAGAYIEDDQHQKLCDLAKSKNMTLAGFCRRLFAAALAEADSPILEHPSYVPDTGGCKSDCGHSEEEHIAFDMGLYDGEQGNEKHLPQLITAYTPRCVLLLEAWHTGHSVGVINRSKREGA
ncbi:hypothetical protein [Prosthecobacter vanneervenii]|uniref:Folate-dependent phosphoribosylglycinamide formyltransferase PurN n=1 Tax=Prosthecobacter vanneervenii TaxID=48466 RepID=A0A7W7YBH0_9BACT|nr:hypothetical protein [Prosthecobacter vanneervenii]MBB5033136.1 folate-dependent phosphoribosylglycinamide formyltransferase PurN [Prosthecobacter vanneervenii]